MEQDVALTVAYVEQARSQAVVYEEHQPAPKMSYLASCCGHTCCPQCNATHQSRHLWLIVVGQSASPRFQASLGHRPCRTCKGLGQTGSSKVAATGPLVALPFAALYHLFLYKKAQCALQRACHCPRWLPRRSSNIQKPSDPEPQELRLAACCAKPRHLFGVHPSRA